MSRIHIFGASGSGTTTLGAALAAQLDCPHFDADDFFWLPTDPPFQEPRELATRQKLLFDALSPHASWVLSGCTNRWGDPIIPMTDLGIFLWIPRHIRMDRLRKREIERYGEESVCPGGVWCQASARFFSWAYNYDEGGLNIRSRAMHEQLISNLPCPVLRIEGDISTKERLRLTMLKLKAM